MLWTPHMPIFLPYQRWRYSTAELMKDLVPVREAIHKEKSQNCGVFPNITEAILVDEISTKVRIYPPKVITLHQNLQISNEKDRFPQEW